MVLICEVAVLSIKSKGNKIGGPDIQNSSYLIVRGGVLEEVLVEVERLKFS